MTCPHHWHIEQANGPESLGICRDCGERRMFKNSTYIHPFRDTIPLTTQEWFVRDRSPDDE